MLAKISHCTKSMKNLALAFRLILGTLHRVLLIKKAKSKENLQTVAANQNKQKAKFRQKMIQACKLESTASEQKSMKIEGSII